MASKTYPFSSLKRSGQFGAEKGGLFAAEWGGQFKTESGGLFERNFHHTGKMPEIPVNGNSIAIKEKRKQVSEMLKDEGADDDELTVFEYWMDGIYKPADIGKDLGVDVKDIYVIIKRLKRKLEKIEQQTINIV